MSLLDIRLLGGFHLAWNDNPANLFHSTRQQSLLAYLLLHKDAPQPRRQIAFNFWPETAEKQALTNLRQLFHHLRTNFLEHDRFICSTNRTLQWNTDASFRLDIDRFTHAITQSQSTGSPTRLRTLLGEAVELYRGPLFPDCYDDWILPIREGLHQQFVGAMSQLIQLTEEAGEFAKAIGFAQRLLQHDPLYEAAHRQLMQLHLQHRDRAAAMRAYHDCATLLRNELGVEPSAETAAVYDRLLSDDEQPPREAVIREAEPSDLIGRMDELHLLCAAWGDAAVGRAQLFVIAGEAGIGKTRLAEELLVRNGRHGISAVRTRSYAAAGDLAYGPIAEWLRADVLKRRWHSLGETWLSEIARIVPELLVEQPTLPKPEPLTERWQRKHLFEALAHAFCAHTAPLLLLLDDLQWCDSDTLEFLHFLLRHEPAKPLLIVGTVRPEEVDKEHPLTDLLLNLHSDGLVQEIELAPLGQEATAALANQTATYELEPDKQRSVLRATAGNPLYIVETVRSQSYLPLQSEDSQDAAFAIPDLAERQAFIPPRVYAVIQRRLNTLSPVARELASVAAVIGRAFSFDLLAAVSQYAEDAMVRGLDELWQRRLVREHGLSDYDFSHDRIRDVAYGEIGAVERRELHGRVAKRLRKTIQNSSETDKAAHLHGALALHYQEAHLWDRAVEQGRLAAQISYDLFAYTDAVKYFEESLKYVDNITDETVRIEKKLSLLFDLAEAKGVTHGDSSLEVGNLYREARSLSLQHDEKPMYLQSLLGLRRHYGTRGEWNIAYEVSQKTVSIVEGNPEADGLSAAYHLFGCTLFHRGLLNMANSYQHKADLIGSKRPNLDYPKLGVWSQIARTKWHLGFPLQAIEWSEKALTEARASKQPFSMIFGLEYATMLQIYLLNNCKALQYASEFYSITEKYDFADYFAPACALYGWTAFVNGNHEFGIELVSQCLESAYKTTFMFMLPFYLNLCADVQARQGYIEQACLTAKRAVSISESSDDTCWLPELYRFMGVLVRTDSPDIGHDYFQKAISIAQRQSAKSLELRATVSLARLWQEQGKRQEAHQILSEIYGWFTEGFDTKDLIEAKELLDELAGS